MPFSADSHG
ncbi:hypothetical protein D018_1372A, partial [Vibrio parahaemolyticus VP2007-007]